METQQLAASAVSASLPRKMAPDQWELGAYRVSRNCTVGVVADGPMTGQDIDKLIAHLNLSRESIGNDPIDAADEGLE